MKDINKKAIYSYKFEDIIEDLTITDLTFLFLCYENDDKFDEFLDDFMQFCLDNELYNHCASIRDENIRRNRKIINI